MLMWFQLPTLFHRLQGLKKEIPGTPEGKPPIHEKKVSQARFPLIASNLWPCSITDMVRFSVADLWPHTEISAAVLIGAASVVRIMYVSSMIYAL